MKKIDKQTLPIDHAFQVFYDTHNANYIAQGYDGRTMWKYFRINKDARLELHDALLKEQGYICCYCGCRIDKETKENGLSVEHFERKGNPATAHLALTFSNLMACCKRSQVVDKKANIPFPIPNEPNIRTLQQVADYLNIEMLNIRNENNHLKKIQDDDDLNAINKKKPDNHKITNIYYNPNLHHCDDTKDVNRISPIINPTTEIGCEFLFQYDIITKIKGDVCEITPFNPNMQIIQDTIDFLNLNANDLLEQRVIAYNKGIEYQVDYQNIIEELSNEGINAFVTDFIQNEIYKKDENGRFKKFCFVTAVVFKSGLLP